MKRYEFADVLAAIGIMAAIWAFAATGFGSWCAQADHCDDEMFNRIVFYLFVPLSAAMGIAAAIVRARRRARRDRIAR